MAPQSANQTQEIQANVSWQYLFHGQFQHLLLGLGLIAGALYLTQSSFQGQTFWGITDRQWAYWSIGLAVAHQVLTWLGWRLQLVAGGLSRLFGSWDMPFWAALFFPLLLARPLTVFGAGMSDFGSLAGPRAVHIAAGVVLLIPALYTFWSVRRYFGLARAMGGDHFRRKYREMPLVREGAFRYSSNAMYIFGFMLLWGIALLTGSQAALGLALFQHAYIWVHMYCTENPDIETIYNA